MECYEDLKQMTILLSLLAEDVEDVCGMGGRWEVGGTRRTVGQWVCLVVDVNNVAMHGNSSMIAPSHCCTTACLPGPPRMIRGESGGVHEFSQVLSLQLKQFGPEKPENH